MFSLTTQEPRNQGSRMGGTWRPPYLWILATFPSKCQYRLMEVVRELWRQKFSTWCRCAWKSQGEGETRRMVEIVSPGGETQNLQKLDYTRCFISDCYPPLLFRRLCLGDTPLFCFWPWPPSFDFDSLHFQKSNEIADFIGKIRWTYGSNKKRGYPLNKRGGIP